MIRNVIAIVIAFFSGGIAVFLLETLGHTIYPLPDGVDPSDMKQIAEYVKTAPIGSILFVLLAQCGGSLTGGWVAGLIGTAKKLNLGMIYGFLALLMAGLNLILIPSPIWFIVLSLALPIPLAILGAKLSGRDKSNPSRDATHANAPA